MNNTKFFKCDDGNLYDNRPDWARNPLRENYSTSYRKIENGKQLRSTLRTPYAWPGGYEVLFGTSCGACLCRNCVVENLKSVIWSIRNTVSDGFKVDQSFTTAEIDGPMYCDNCSKELTGYEGEENGN